MSPISTVGCCGPSSSRASSPAHLQPTLAGQQTQMRRHHAQRAARRIQQRVDRSARLVSWHGQVHHANGADGKACEHRVAIVPVRTQQGRARDRPLAQFRGKPVEEMEGVARSPLQLLQSQRHRHPARQARRRLGRDRIGRRDPRIDGRCKSPPATRMSLRGTGLVRGRPAVLARRTWSFASASAATQLHRARWPPPRGRAPSGSRATAAAGRPAPGPRTPSPQRSPGTCPERCRA